MRPVVSLLLWVGALMLASTERRAAPEAQGVLDRASLVIRDGTRVIGREEFVLRRGRGPGVTDGFSLRTTALFPPDFPERRLSAVIEFGPDSQPAAARFDVQDGAARRVLYHLSTRRITVRVLGPSGESAREYPGTARFLIADDSLFGGHALAPAAGAGPVRVVSSAGGRGASALLSDDGDHTTVVGGVELTLHRFTVRLGGEVRYLWYDADGRLMKVEIPGRHITASRERLPGR